MNTLKKVLITTTLVGLIASGNILAVPKYTTTRSVPISHIGEGGGAVNVRIRTYLAHHPGINVSSVTRNQRQGRVVGYTVTFTDGVVLKMKKNVTGIPAGGTALAPTT